MTDALLVVRGTVAVVLLGQLLARLLARWAVRREIRW